MSTGDWEKLKPLGLWLQSIEGAYYNIEVIKKLMAMHKETWTSPEDLETKHARLVEIIRQLDNHEQLLAKNVGHIVGVYPLEPWSND